MSLAPPQANQSRRLRRERLGRQLPRYCNHNHILHTHSPITANTHSTPILIVLESGPPRTAAHPRPRIPGHDTSARVRTGTWFSQLETPVAPREHSRPLHTTPSLEQTVTVWPRPQAQA